MDITYKTDCEGVDWNKVPEIIHEAGLRHYSPELHQKAFENSYAAVFAFESGRLIGCGRAISDGAYQAALYDLVVIPEFQGRGIGSTILDMILEKVSHCHVILYAAPDKEPYYRKHGFRQLKTGMAKFLNPELPARKGITD